MSGGRGRNPAQTGLRRAGPGDLEAILGLERRALADPWSRRALAEQLAHPRGLVLVAERDGELQGYAGFLDLGPGDDGVEAELLRVAVDPARRRAGLGRRLVEAGLERLGAAVCHLEVRPENRAARAFYRRLGFAESGRRRRYYPDGGDALRMARRP